MQQMLKLVRSEEPAAYVAPLAADNDNDLIAKALEVMDRKIRKGGELVRDPAAAGRYGKLKLADRDREVFAVMLLDTRHRVLDWQELHYGTIDGAEVHPRVVARAALLANASAVICFHNHPSGNPEPSAADRAVTARLKQALALLDIRLLDHFVIAEGDPVSLAAKGWV